MIKNYYGAMGEEENVGEREIDKEMRKSNSSMRYTERDTRIRKWNGKVIEYDDPPRERSGRSQI